MQWDFLKDFGASARFPQKTGIGAIRGTLGSRKASVQTDNLRSFWALSICRWPRVLKTLPFCWLLSLSGVFFLSDFWSQINENGGLGAGKECLSKRALVAAALGGGFRNTSSERILKPQNFPPQNHVAKALFPFNSEGSTGGSSQRGFCRKVSRSVFRGASSAHTHPSDSWRSESYPGMQERRFSQAFH